VQVHLSSFDVLSQSPHTGRYCPFPWSFASSNLISPRPIPISYLRDAGITSAAHTLPLTPTPAPIHFSLALPTASHHQPAYLLYLPHCTDMSKPPAAPASLPLGPVPQLETFLQRKRNILVATANAVYRYAVSYSDSHASTCTTVEGGVVYQSYGRSRSKFCTRKRLGESLSQSRNHGESGSQNESYMTRKVAPIINAVAAPDECDLLAVVRGGVVQLVQTQTQFLYRRRTGDAALVVNTVAAPNELSLQY